MKKLMFIMLTVWMACLSVFAVNQPATDCSAISAGIIYTFDDPTSRYVLYTDDNTSMDGGVRTMEECWRVIGWEADGATGYSDFKYPRIATDNASFQYSYSSSSALLLYQYSSTSYTTVGAIMPVVAGNLDTMKVTFWARAGYVTSNSLSQTNNLYQLPDMSPLLVGVMTDPANESTFQLLETIVGPGSGNADPETDSEGTGYWRQYSVNLAGVVGQYICFKSNGGNINYCIDDVQLLRGDDCVRPRDLAVSNITTTSATFSWSSGSSSSFDLGLILNGDTTIYNIVNANSYTLSNLQPTTGYRVVVRSNCGDGSVSVWSDPVAFTTECLLDLPYRCGFDGESLVDQVPQCWKRGGDAFSDSHTQRGAFVVSGTGYAATGSRALQIEHRADRADSVWVTLPEMNCNRLDTLQLTFKIRAAYQAYGDQLYSYTDDSQYAHSIRVGMVNSAGDIESFRLLRTITAQNIAHLTQASSDAKKYWETVTIPLDNNGGHCIAFLSNFGMNNTIFIDDIVIDAPMDCTEPTAIFVDSLNKTHALVHWTGDADSYQVILKRGNTVDSTYVVNDTITSLNNLIANTSYSITVRSLCGNDQSEDFIGATFTTFAGIPFLEDFNNQLPSSWSQAVTSVEDVFNGGELTQGVQWYCFDATYTNMTGSYTMCSKTYTSNQRNWLVSPTIYVDDVPVGMSAQLSFDLAMYADRSGEEAPDYTGCNDDRFMVLVSTDHGQTWSRNNVTSWTLDGAGTYDMATLSNNVQKAYIDLTQYLGGTVTLAFYLESTIGNSDNRIHIDNVKIQSYWPDAPGIVNVKMLDTRIIGSTAQITYAANSDQTAIVKISKSANASSPVITDTIYNSTVYTMPALQPNTTYYLSVRQLGSQGHMSDWEQISFKTPYGLAFTTSTSSSSRPADWSGATARLDDIMYGAGELYVTSNSRWSWVKSAAMNKQYHFRNELYGTSTREWIISPSIDLGPNVGSGIVLRFSAYLTPKSTQYVSVRDNGTDDRFAVVISTDEGKTWEILSEWNNHMGDSAGNYVLNNLPETGSPISFDMTKYAGQKIKIAFYGESTEANADNYLGVGNIVLDTMPTTRYDAVVCDGDDYDGAEDGNQFYVSYTDYKVGMNMFTQVRAASGSKPMGMDILYLRVDTASYTYYDAYACVNQMYEDDNFSFMTTATTEREMRRIYTSQSGCDSVVVMNLEVIAPVFGETDTVYACEASLPYEWNGKFYNTTGFYIDTIPTIETGCDSIVMLLLVAMSPDGEDRDLTLCYGESVDINGETVTASGEYREELISVLTGCDSVIIWHVTVKDSLFTHRNALICRGDNYTDANFLGLTEPGNYATDIIKSVDGCDSIVSLTLLVSENGQPVETYISPADLPYILNDELLLPEGTTEGTYTKQVDVACGTVTVTIHLSASPVIDIWAEREMGEKVIVNGHLYIIRNDQWYDATGRHVNLEL